MAQWARVCQLPQNALSRLMSAYSNTSNTFPMEVRHYCATWIENQKWDGLNEEHEEIASYLLTTLVGFLNDDSVGINVRQRYMDIANYLQSTFTNRPLEFVHIVNTCLEAERAIISEAENSCSQNQSVETQAEMATRIDKLYLSTFENGKVLQEIQAQQHQYANMHEDKMRIEEAISRLEQAEAQQNITENEQQWLPKLKNEKLNKDNSLLNSCRDIFQKRGVLAQNLKGIINTLDSLVMQVVDVKLAEWKQKQKMALVHFGAKFEEFKEIEHIQEWCDKLADITLRIRNQIDSLNDLMNGLSDGELNLQPENKTKINSVLSKLVTGAFIVERQPYQVLKKGSKFDVTVRWLVHGKLAVFGTPKIKQTLISEEEARRLNDNADVRLEKETILTKELRMECPSLTFKDVKVKTISRASKTNNDITTVAEQKYGILFSFCLKAGEDLVLTVRTMTIPVVMTTHGSYERSSTATYLWDNHFSQPRRIPFQVPNEVSWPDFANMLTTVFHGMTCRHLTESNLQYLGQKIFGTSDDFSSYTVSWNQFVKDDIPGFNFKFWDWFWLIAKLVKDHLKGPWNEGLIEGFADKIVTNDHLKLQPPGTFVLRFSDGTLGALTIAWVDNDPNNPGQKIVINLSPFNSKDFTSRGLADRIKDLTSLLALYPNIPKHEAFGKYYSQDKDTSELNSRGYVPHSLMMNVNSDLHSNHVQARSPPSQHLFSTLQSSQVTQSFQQGQQTHMGADVLLGQPMNDDEMSTLFAVQIPQPVASSDISFVSTDNLDLEDRLPGYLENMDIAESDFPHNTELPVLDIDEYLEQISTDTSVLYCPEEPMSQKGQTE